MSLVPVGERGLVSSGMSTVVNERDVANIPIFKIIIVGDSGVGKSCLVQKFVHNLLADHRTVGADVQHKTIKLNGIDIALEIWDTAGVEISDICNIGNIYHNANGFIIVYDITNRESFNHVEKWLQALNEKTAGDGEIMIIGNKSDLKNERAITADMGIELSMQYGTLFLEVSSVKGINVNRTFNKLATTIMQKHLNFHQQRKQQPLAVEINNVNSNNRTSVNVAVVAENSFKQPLDYARYLK